jgi:hypothetical protein
VTVWAISTRGDGYFWPGWAMIATLDFLIRLEPRREGRRSQTCS